MKDSGTPRLRSILRRALATALTCVVAVMLYFAVTFAQVMLSSRSDHVRNAQAIVVLGAAQYNGKPAKVLTARLDHAYELWRTGYAPLLVVTGGKAPGDSYSEATASAEYLIAKGVPDEKILREVHGRNTWQSLAAASRFLKDRDITDVVLVSDSYHSLRLQHVASELGLKAAVSPVPDSPISSKTRLTHTTREAIAVGVGRIISFRRLSGLDAKMSSS